MKQYHYQPEWNDDRPISSPYSKGIRCGEMIWFGEQVDAEAVQLECKQQQLATQTGNVVRDISSVLNGLGCDLQDLVFLHCFYVNDGSIDEKDFLNLVANCLPEGTQTAINAVPVPTLSGLNVRVQIDGCAMRRIGGQRMPRCYAHSKTILSLPPKFCHALKCGQMIFVSGQYPMNAEGVVLEPGDIIAQTHIEMKHIEALLAQLGAQFHDVVKSNRWYSGKAGVDDFEPAALACASYYAEPGPAATGIPLPRHADDRVAIKLSCVAMRGEDGCYLPRKHVWPDTLWDWTTHLPYKHGVQCAGMIFVGGQVSLNTRGITVNPNDMTAQVRQAMEHINSILHALGSNFSELCQLKTFYQANARGQQIELPAKASPSDISESLPTVCKIPLPELAYEGMVVEIEAFGMTDPDRQF